MAAIGASVGIEMTGLEAMKIGGALTMVVALDIETGLVAGQMFAADTAVDIQENCADENFPALPQMVAVVEKILVIEAGMVTGGKPM
ncbi:hypothetical protein BTUL_0140g00270 [Botrytis tulipae]|uniref:Uncharacterized protein n=1 Tax=Botrytis tulipae TaxID=87230 RepID=A0A4Z1EDB9_9HELO|nr:hypothetical protein BTUL_0140g00270 [Botrytis tulipae]